MAELVLYRGNRNYSSWSMRAWLALEQTGQAFREEGFHLGEPGVRAKIRRHSPSGRVPALRHGDLVIWDSLAICEYLAETFPDARLWPADAALRAVARAVSAEMHSQFTALREHMPFNVRRSSPGKGRGPGVQDDIERITAIWRDCRERFGGDGPYLFAEWSIADIMYAPVVSRFLTYGVDVDDVARAYMAAVWSRADVSEWRAAAQVEPEVEPKYDL